MKAEVFDRFREIIYRQCGIVLSDEKKALLGGRIQRRLREHGLSTEAEYLDIIELDTDGSELIQLIDAVSTNTTYFWREPEHFDVLGGLLETWRSQGKTKIRIWCAASSTGQEPYTLAMETLEHTPVSFDIKILATDVSTKVLKIAQSGRYSEEEVSKLPSDKKSKFMVKVPPSAESPKPGYRVSPALCEKVLFKKLNLVEFPYPLRGPLDIIFCRNVMIYFDLQTRQKIIDEFVRLMPKGGYLFLSLSESLLGIEHSLSKVSTSVYQK